MSGPQVFHSGNGDRGSFPVLIAALSLALGLALGALLVLAWSHWWPEDEPDMPPAYSRRLADVEARLDALTTAQTDLLDRVLQWRGRDHKRAQRSREPDAEAELRARYPAASSRFIARKLAALARENADS